METATSLKKQVTDSALERVAVSYGVWGRIVIGLLQKMQLGRLQLTGPDGNTVTIGSGEGAIQCNIVVSDPEFFRHCVLYGDIGFGEAYVNGWWSTDDLTQVIRWFLLNVENSPCISGSKVNVFAANVLRFFNKIYHRARPNSVSGSKKNISEHYDLNNDFFAVFLDDTMTYSSALYESANQSLHDAQVAKYDRLCQQLKLVSTDEVLEIGSGWGGNAVHIAKNYGCHVTTTTISQEQFKYVCSRVEKEGLGDRITVLLKDYRDLEGTYDKIVSIEMLEAVGKKFLNTYFAKCHQLLKKDGILAFQVITCPDSRFKSLARGVDWIQKHIFPGSLLPSVAAINKAVNKTGDMTMVDLKDMGLDYARTLKEWHEAFNRQLSRVFDLGFDHAFVRKWNYYLCYCEAAFDMRNINVMQMVYSRPNNTNR